MVTTYFSRRIIGDCAEWISHMYMDRWIALEWKIHDSLNETRKLNVYFIPVEMYVAIEMFYPRMSYRLVPLFNGNAWRIVVIPLTMVI